MKINWKVVANFAKVAVAIEMGCLFWFLPSREAWEIIVLCLAQYAVFAPVDVSLVIKAIKGVK